jgi:hypothetical protein
MFGSDQKQFLQVYKNLELALRVSYICYVNKRDKPSLASLNVLSISQPQLPPETLRLREKGKGNAINAYMRSGGRGLLILNPASR